MEKKIYVVGLEEDLEAKVNSAVTAVAGVASYTANALKAQVLVNFDESTAGIEDSINSAIASCGLEVL